MIMVGPKWTRLLFNICSHHNKIKLSVTPPLCQNKFGNLRCMGKFALANYTPCTVGWARFETRNFTNKKATRLGCSCVGRIEWTRLLFNICSHHNKIKLSVPPLICQSFDCQCFMGKFT